MTTSPNPAPDAVSDAIAPALPKVRYVDDCFGNCPFCGMTDGYLNVGRNHWFHCGVHKTKWPGGYKLFSSWREEDEETWKRNAQLLEGYRQVEPFTPPRAPSPARTITPITASRPETDDPFLAEI